MLPTDGKPTLAPVPVPVPAPAPALAPSQSSSSAHGGHGHGPSSGTTAGSSYTGVGHSSNIGATAPALPGPPPVPRPRNQGGRKKALASIEPDPLYRTSSLGSGGGLSAHSSHSHSTHAHAHAHAHAHSGVGTKRMTDGGSLTANPDGPRKRKRVDPGAYPVGSALTTTHAKHGNVAASHGHGHVSASGRGVVGAGAGFGSGASYQSSVNPNSGMNFAGTTSASGFAGTGGVDADGRSSLIEFTSLPTSALYEYIIQHDLVPVIYPTPLMPDDPPPPTALLDPARMASRAPTPTRYNTSRARRQKEGSKDGGCGVRRRSTRLLEDSEEQRGLAGVEEQVPILADVSALNGVLASIAGRHFRESNVAEVETLMAFIGAVKSKSRTGNGGSSSR